MANISKIALCAVLICALPLMAITNRSLTPVKVTNKNSVLLLTNISKMTGVVSATQKKSAKLAKVEKAPATMTNQTYFTGHLFAVPPKSGNWQEVQDAYSDNIFKDVHQSDSESALRRFEIVFFISLPATLLLNTGLLKVITSFETGQLGGAFDVTRNYYLYAGSALMSIGIACEDYKNVKRRRAAEGFRWDIIQKKF